MQEEISQNTPEPTYEKKVTVMHIKQEVEDSDDSADKVKKEEDLACSLPLSLDVANANVKVNENVGEGMNENSNNLGNYTNIDSFKGPVGNLFDPTPGLSPFMSSNVHNLSFNNDHYRGRNLFTANNFESPYRRNLSQSQFSQLSPLTSIKIPNSLSINKSLNELEGYQQYYNNYADPHDYHFNSKGSFKQFSPMPRRVVNLSRTETKSGVRNLLINPDDCMKDKENVKIKVYQNEKLIKAFFDIKDEIFSSSEENSRKFIKSENSNMTSNTNSNKLSNHDENSQKSRYRIDYGNFLNNTTRTIRNINLDFKINFSESDNGNVNYNYGRLNTINPINPSINSMNNYNIMGGLNYYNYAYNYNYNIPSQVPYEKPQINRNFLKEEKIKHKQDQRLPDASLRKSSGDDIEIRIDKPKVQCNCKKSKCLKLYCECFANEGFCRNCNCVDCHNIEDFAVERNEAINLIKEKNPNAFLSKIEKLDSNNLKHSKGCNCTKSNCMKKYCECYQKGIGCSELCRCRDCKNQKEKENLSSVVLKNNSLINRVKEEEGRSISPVADTKTKRKGEKFEYQIENISINLNSSKEVGEKRVNKLESNIDSINIHLSKSKSKSRSKEPEKNKKYSSLRMTNKKRKRGVANKITNHSKSYSKSNSKSKYKASASDKKNQNIVSLLNKANTLSSHFDTPNSNLICSSEVHSQLPMTTPKKQTRQATLLTNNKKGIEEAKFFNSAQSRRNYKDTTISSMVSTTQTSTKRRIETKLSKNDTSIIRRLDKELINVNNEPLFSGKSKNRGNKQ